MINATKIRKDFPIFKRKINGKRLVYLDNAASTQKPLTVIESMTDFYMNHYSNIHRGIYKLSEEATELYEKAHKKVSDFVNCSFEEIIFTRSTTESLNLVAYTAGDKFLAKNDEILLTQIEHHSNMLPWQYIAKKKGAVIRYAEINKDGTLDYEDFKKKLSKKTKIVSMTSMSNSLGTITNIKELSKISKDNGSLFVVDGAQGVPHNGFDVKKINCDFLAFSGHKLLGPTGIGGLYGKKEILEEIEPFNYGGDMIREVSFKKASWNELPWKFEAGTQNIAGAIGFGAAIEYIMKIGFNNIKDHEKSLTKYAYKRLSEIEGLKIYGPKPDKRGPIIPFNIKSVPPHDVASILDDEGVCIRAGHHCTMPLMDLLCINGSVRASFYIYNNKEDVDLLIDGITKVKKVFMV